MPLARPVPILLAVRELDLGGIERDLTKVAIHIDRTRFTPHVASYNAHGMRYEELRRANVPLLHLPLSSLLSSAAIKQAARFLAYLKQHKIRLVHAYDNIGTFVLPLARLAGVPVIIASTLGNRELFDPRSRRQLRVIDKIVDTVVVNCEALRRHLVTDEGIPAEQIELCYNGVEPTQFYPARDLPRPRELAGAELVIGTVCVLRPEKTLDVLQEAFARVRYLQPGMRLVVVGNGPELERLQANSARLGIQQESIFVPATPDVPKWLNAIDIFVLSSRSEAFPNALLEAMACGCCTVASRVGGTPEMLGDNEYGLLFTPGDATELTNRLELLIRDENLRRELGARAADCARLNFSIGKNVARTAGIYDELILRKGFG